MVPDGTQNFESVCFIEARLIARAGEIVVMVSANNTPKLSNLFFIFLFPFVFVFCGGFCIFNLLIPCHSEFISESFILLSSLLWILKQVQDDGW